MQPHRSSHPIAADSVAAAIEEYVRGMESSGYAKFAVQPEVQGYVLTFGKIRVHGETYDVGLLRLASALIDSVEFCAVFIERMRKLDRNSPAVSLSDSFSSAREEAVTP